MTINLFSKLPTALLMGLRFRRFSYLLAGLSLFMLASAQKVEVCPELLPEQFRFNLDDPNRWMGPMYQGEYGWLFRPLDLSEDIVLQDAALEYVERFRAFLAEKGIKLMMLNLPKRGILYSDKLDQGLHPNLDYSAQKAIAGYYQLQDWLHAHDILSPDLLGAFLAYQGEDNLFLKRDNHWRAAGAALAAEEVAKALDYLALPATESYRLKSTDQQEKGVLAQRVESFCHSELPLEDSEWVSLIDDQEADSAEDLFGTSHIPVVILGTSQSLRLYPHLANLLQTKILNIALEGGGEAGSLIEYFSDRSWQEDKPEVLIWERSNKWDMDMETLRAFEQLMPHLAETRQCSSWVALKPNKRNTMFRYNPKTDDLALDLRPGENYLDIRFSRKNVRVVNLELEYDDARTDGAWLGKSQLQNGGRFFFEPWLAGQGALLKVSLLEPTQLKGKNIQVDLRICNYQTP
ncbi:MAG: hypothetical protein R2880_21760 [Deinococcales bacterium]